MTGFTLKFTANTVEVQKESGDNTSTSNQLSPLKDPKSTLKFTGVEVVEMSEIFSDLLLSR